MNAGRMSQFSDAESYLNSRRPEREFVPGSHRSWGVTRSLNCLRGISEPILRCYQAPVVVRQAQKKPLYTHRGGMCGYETDVCQHRHNLDSQCRKSEDVSHEFYLVPYWFIDAFTHFGRQNKYFPKTTETCKAAHNTHMHTIITIIMFSLRSQRRF